MGIVAIIAIASVVVVIVIVLTILVYNQMLLLNEVNKRLLLLAQESIHKERVTQEELHDALLELERQANNPNTEAHNPTPEYNPGFIDPDLE